MHDNLSYQARLRSNGKIVVVKVQRPGAQAAFSLDIFILRFLAGIARKTAKLNTGLPVRLCPIIYPCCQLKYLFLSKFTTKAKRKKDATIREIHCIFFVLSVVFTGI